MEIPQSLDEVTDDAFRLAIRMNPKDVNGAALRFVRARLFALSEDEPEITTSETVNEYNYWNAVLKLLLTPVAA